MKTPECPYAKHEPSEFREIWPAEVKVIFAGHEVMGKGWACDKCCKPFFIVQTFNEEKPKFIGKKSK